MNDNSKRVELHVYIETGCEQCERAVQLAQEIDNGYSRLAVSVIDVGESAVRPDDVFAVPTFMLNGRVFSLGNPQETHLRQEIEALLRERDSV
ncbi:MAG: thioredoxin family protein [Chloroflexi bacterium]|nr:thioredoxin family protein [Chloroflexota bacterium]